MIQAGAFGAHRKFDMLCAEERSSAYLDHDLEKNIFGSFYHVREPKTRRLPMTVADFAVCLASWTSKKLLLKVFEPFPTAPPGCLPHLDTWQCF